MAHEVTVIPGDGSGPELVAATCRVLEATGVEFRWDEQHAGEELYRREGIAFPDSLLPSILRTKVALKGPTSAAVGSEFPSVNVRLRQELDLFACVRPCRTYKGVKSHFPDADIVIFRENTEDLFSGMEFVRGSKESASLRAFLADDADILLREDTGVSLKPISHFCSERIVEAAFQYAKANNRRKVTAGHKANIMRGSDGLFLEVARAVAARHPEIEFEGRLIDNLCGRLLTHTDEFDVIVLPNLYGDIVADLGAAMIGGLGVAGGGNFGSEVAVFEATHGTVSKHKGQNRANPTALLLSGAFMLRHIAEIEAAQRLERAIASVIAAGSHVTYDLKPNRDDPTAVSTNQFADAVIEVMDTEG